MADLQDTLEVGFVDFQYDSLLVRYRNDKLKVNARDDKEVFRFANGSLGENVRGIFLEFELNLRYLEVVQVSNVARVSEAGIKGLTDALLDTSIAVEFRPIPALDASVRYDVILEPSTRTMLLTDEKMFTPQMNMTLLATERLTALPSWLEVARVNI